MIKCDEPFNITIMGASLDTGNLGVNALLASTIGWIYKVCPDAHVKLFSGVPNPTPQIITLENGKRFHIERLGIRTNKTLWRKNHLVRLLVEAGFKKMLPYTLSKHWQSKNPFMQELMASNVVLDITGGDSFTDMYGVRRFFFSFLSKLLIIICGLKLVLLPQTYGPFSRPWTKLLARYILKRSQIICSRDEEGLYEVKKLVQETTNPPIFCPDVAFGLHSYQPKNFSTYPDLPKQKKKSIVGFNISGLLYSGGYSRNNSFNLKVNYKECVLELIDTLLTDNNISILLIPHVFPRKKLMVESDPLACSEVYKEMNKKFPGRIFLLEGEYDQSEIKWVIGKCDFFLGSRMHACIAALSQGIPAIALAYSKKFLGVYKSIGIEKLVFDLRYKSIQEQKVDLLKLYKNHDELSKHLFKEVPLSKEKILHVFSLILAMRSGTRKTD